MKYSATAQRRARSDSGGAARGALLAAARTCVGNHGIAQTTSRLIASEANENLAAITYYFGSKDELVAEALFGELERRLAPIMSLLEDDTPATVRLLSAVQDLTAEFERSDPDVPIYLNALLLSTEADPIADRGRQLVAGLVDRLATVIESLLAEGTIAAWIAPREMASLLVSCANGMALQTRLDPAGPGVGAMATQLAGLMLAASTGTAVTSHEWPDRRSDQVQPHERPS